MKSTVYGPWLTKVPSSQGMEKKVGKSFQLVQGVQLVLSKQKLDRVGRVYYRPSTVPKYTKI